MIRLYFSGLPGLGGGPLTAGPGTHANTRVQTHTHAHTE